MGGTQRAFADRFGDREFSPHRPDIIEDVVVVDPDKPVLALADDSAGVMKLIEFPQRAPIGPHCSTNVTGSFAMVGS